MSDDAKMIGPANTCGTCRWAQPADPQHIACFGAPPTPIIVGQRPGQFGGMQLQFENIRPILKNEEKACSLHRIKLHFDLGAARAEGTG